jgi:UDP-4-amino-4,6-dideoxy-N-acetyl-beta-L-altrosamine transaminase
MLNKYLPYGLHDISKADIKEVVKVLKSDWITTGQKIGEFEKAMCDYTGAKYAVAVSSGTAALDLAIACLGLPPGCEAITTPLTFVASSNVLVCNGVKPVFADINPYTLNIDVESVKKKVTARTKLILCVDYAGQPCQIDELKQIAKEHNLFLVEDAAHSLGAEYKGQKVGGLADLTIFSFHPVKHITTGEGGMILTNNEVAYKKLLLMRNHGIDKEVGSRVGYEYDMKVLGVNYRITDFQCALGISQLKRLDEFIKKRRLLVGLYKNAFQCKELYEVQTITEYQSNYDVSECVSSWHIFPILLPKGTNRDEVFKKMRAKNIGVNVHYIPVYRHTYYKEHYVFNQDDCPVTEDVFGRLLTLPLFPAMTQKDIARVVTALKEAIK